MKRGLLVLAAALLVALLASLAIYRLRVRQPAVEWMGRQLGLEGVALAEFTAAHARYRPACAEMCRRIRAADEELATAMVSGRSVTPEVSAALERSDALHTQCRKGMLAHFYEVANLLDERQRQQYLQMVLPLIAERGRMEGAHRGP